MAIIKQYRKDIGVTYVYESKSYWDREKQQPRAKMLTSNKACN